MTPAQANKRIARWQQKLGLGSWEVRYSPIAADEENRASSNLDYLHRRAVVRVAKECPESQVDREIVHELLHILMGGMGDLFDRSASDHQAEAREFLHGQWQREQEWAIERLVNLLTDSTIGHFGEPDEVWSSAFPA